MAAKILDGKALAARLRAALGDEARALGARGVQPGLAVVLVGDDPASQLYVRSKTRACAEAGGWSARGRRGRAASAARPGPPAGRGAGRAVAVGAAPRERGGCRPWWPS